MRRSRRASMDRSSAGSGAAARLWPFAYGPSDPHTFRCAVVREGPRRSATSSPRSVIVSLRPCRTARTSDSVRSTSSLSSRPSSSTDRSTPSTKWRIACSLVGSTPVVKTPRSDTGMTNGAPLMHQLCSSDLSSAIAEVKSEADRSSTRACSEVSADPGGLFWMPQAPATWTSALRSSRSSR